MNINFSEEDYMDFSDTLENIVSTLENFSERLDYIEENFSRGYSRLGSAYAVGGRWESELTPSGRDTRYGLALNNAKYRNPNFGSMSLRKRLDAKRESLSSNQCYEPSSGDYSKLVDKRRAELKAKRRENLPKPTGRRSRGEPRPVAIDKRVKSIIDTQRSKGIIK